MLDVKSVLLPRALSHATHGKSVKILHHIPLNGQIIHEPLAVRRATHQLHKDVAGSKAEAIQGVQHILTTSTKVGNKVIIWMES